MPNRRVLVALFIAYEANGKSHLIVVTQDMIDVTTAAGPGEIPGLKHLMCGSFHVNRLSKGKYELISNRGELIPLSSDDPNAI